MTVDTARGEQVLSTPLTELLGIRHPILLAPMGDAAGGRLAAAVSDAGAFGLIGGGYGDPAWLARELELAGDSRVGVGFITFALEDRPDALRLALDARPPAIQLSFGDPRPHADEIHDAGALLICQAQTTDEIDLAVAAGADIIVAQGRDAGGHGRPDRGTMALIPAVVDRVGPIPVVAAGGIADGRGLAAALVLGASGITLGTRLLASTEAISHPAELDALVRRSGEDTVRTPAFDTIRGPAWPTGHDGRALHNDLIDAFDRGEPHADLRARYRGADPDDISLRPVWAGEGLDLITNVEPAAQIVASILRQAAATIGAVSSGRTS